MRVFVYYTSGNDETIYLVFARDREEADKITPERVGDEDDFDVLHCAEYGQPLEPCIYIIRG